jgi:hypothetical protein
MADDINYDADFDEYSQLEAEAESLAQDATKAKAPQVNDPRMVPGRVGTAGRGPRPSPVTVVQRPAAPQRPQVPQQQQRQVTQEQEMEALEEEEAAVAEEEEIEQSQPKPQKLVAFHQPEKIGLVNTETKEIIDGFKDIGTATGQAKILNELDSIIVSGGFQ